MQALKTFAAANAAVCRLCRKSTVCFSTSQQIHVRAAAGPASVMAIRSAKNWARVGKHLYAKAARPCKKHSFQAPDAREFTEIYLKICRFAQVGHAMIHRIHRLEFPKDSRSRRFKTVRDDGAARAQAPGCQRSSCWVRSKRKRRGPV